MFTKIYNAGRKNIFAKFSKFIIKPDSIKFLTNVNFCKERYMLIAKLFLEAC